MAKPIDPKTDDQGTDQYEEEIVGATDDEGFEDIEDEETDDEEEDLPDIDVSGLKGSGEKVA